MAGYKSNIKPIAEKIRKQGLSSLTAGKVGVETGQNRFRTKIISEQMSGRKGGSGLNVGTGALRSSWTISTGGDAKAFIATLSSNSHYAIVHQTGMTIRARNQPFMKFKTKTGWVTTKEVTIPKRLNVKEAFLTSGVRILRNEVTSNIINAFK